MILVPICKEMGLEGGGERGGGGGGGQKTEMY